jgi:hypothetical protein
VIIIRGLTFHPLASILSINGLYYFIWLHIILQGPLHTWAKSRDHEIVRAQKKGSKGRPNTPPKSCDVVTDPQV